MKRILITLSFLFFATGCNEEVKLTAEMLEHKSSCDEAFAAEALLIVAPGHEAKERIYFKEDCKLKGYELTQLKKLRKRWNRCLDGEVQLLDELKTPKIYDVLKKGFLLQSKVIEPEGVDKEKYYNHYYAAIKRMHTESNVIQFCRSIIAVMNVWKKKYKDK